MHPVEVQPWKVLFRSQEANPVIHPLYIRRMSKIKKNLTHPPDSPWIFIRWITGIASIVESQNYHNFIQLDLTFTDSCEVADEFSMRNYKSAPDGIYSFEVGIVGIVKESEMYEYYIKIFLYLAVIHTQEYCRMCNCV